MVSPNVSRETLPFPLSPEQAERLRIFSELLGEWNGKINLVSPRDLPRLRERHIEDSLQLAALIPARLAGRGLTDLGSGGGFPGLVLGIALNIPVTLVESDQRRCAFLREAARLCTVQAVIVPQRIEQAVLPPAGIVTARALAPLPRLLALAVPKLAEDGICLFPKGKNVEAELAQAQRDWHMDRERFPSRTDREAVILRLSHIRPRTRPDETERRREPAARQDGKSP